MTPLEAAVEAALALRRGGEDDLCIIVPAAVTAFLEAIGPDIAYPQARAFLAALKELAKP